MRSTTGTTVIVVAITNDAFFVSVKSVRDGLQRKVPG